MRRALQVIVPAVALAALAPGAAYAAWTGAGSGAGSATAASVLQANAPTATRGAGSVGLSWAASTLSSGTAVGRYDVVRHQGASSTIVCSGVTTTSCTDSAPLPGPVQYGVVARIGTSWKGPQSTLTGFTYDNVAPTTSMTTSPASPDGLNGWYVHDVSVTLTASDPGSPAAGVKEIHYTVDGGTEQVVTGSTATFLVAQEQVNSISYWAIDDNGNTESPVKAGSVKLDKTKPVSTITTNDASGWNTAGTISLSATDGTNGSGVASILYKVDGAAQYSTYTTPVALPDGTRAVTYHAVDNAGNAETDRTVTVKVDTVKPTATVNPASGATTNAVTITGSDATSGVNHVEYRLDSAAYVTGSTVTWSPASGPHTVTYRAVDNAGNVGDAVTATYTAVSGGPVLSCGTGKSTITMSWTAYPGATGYVLHYGTNGSTTEAVGPTTLSKTFDSVGAAGTFTVNATTPSGDSPASNAKAYKVGNGLGNTTCTDAP